MADVDDVLFSAVAKYADNYVLKTGYGIVVDSQNTGRNSIKNQDEFKAEVAVYSAIMDERTCDFCASLDEMEFDLRTEEGNTLYAKYAPAQHDRCRCVMIYLLEGDPDIPEEVGVINDGLEDRILDNFKANVGTKKSPSGVKWDTAEMARQYASHNVFSSPQFWIDEIKKIDKRFPDLVEAKAELAIKKYNNFAKNALTNNITGEVSDDGFVFWNGN